MKNQPLRPVINELIKIFKKYHLDYEQIHYVTKTAKSELFIKREKKNSNPIERLSKDEQVTLIQFAYNEPGYIGLLIKTLFSTGVRVSEFVEIQVKDFFFQEEYILIKKAKGDKYRTVPITTDLAQQLKTYIGARKNGYLFESRLHQKYSSRRIQQIVKALGEKAGINKKIHPHLLRHTISTFLLENGMPIEQIQIFLGHEKLETTRIYAKNSPEQIRNEFKKAMAKF